ncbi:MAG: hypothetical protein IPJ95_17025 [Gemmatimonadetes bacterium]|nr:hypothetical protein [Gemmatimonadota bacterium]
MSDRRSLPPNQALLWRMVAVLGFAFLLAGLLNAGTLWFPLELGESEWELGTSSSFFDTFPILGLGIGFLAASSVALGRKWSARSIAAACILIAVFMWLAFALYATVLPLVLRVIKNPVALTPIKKAAAKTVVQALVYPFALLWVAGVAWRATLRRRGSA